MANLRLVLEVEVQAGNQHAAKHSAPGLWTLLDRLGPQCAPWLLRGDRDWGNEGVISAAERRGQAYLFKLRLTKRVKRVLERAMREEDWCDASFVDPGARTNQSTQIRRLKVVRIDGSVQTQ